MHPPDNVGALTPDEWEELDALLDRFERTWRLSDTVDLAEFLPNNHLRPLVLRELIKSELEIRWRRGKRVLLEDYLTRFPELRQDAKRLPPLLYEEYLVRRRQGDRPDLEEYRRRFPDHYAALEQLLRDQPAVTNPQQTPPPPPAPPATPAPPPAAPMGMLGPPSRGDTLPVGGGYKMLKRLGVGSFGEVWHAEAPGGVEVALKIIHRPLDHDEAQRELQALTLIKNLRHSFLLQTQAFWALQDRLIIAMELAEGSLRDRLKECVAAGHMGIPLPELMVYLRETCEALDFLHGKNILHRDLKPDNILLTGRHAKLADLGLARNIGTERSVPATLCGSAPYMAPEIWRGRASAYSDQYSLAATYVELRLNRPLFAHRDMIELMCDHATVEPNLAPLPEPERLVLKRALHKETAERYPSCLEFWQALEAVVAERAPAGGTGTFAQVSQTAVKNPLGPVATAPPGAKTLTGDEDIANPPERTVHDSDYVTITGRSLPPLPRRAEAGDWKSGPAGQRGRSPWSGVILLVGSLVVLAGVVLLAFPGVISTRPTEPSTSSSGSGETPKETAPKDTGPGVVPPPAYFSKNCRPADGSKTRIVDGKEYPSRIVCDLPNGPPVVFLLLAGPDLPEGVRPFYIMQTKVTNRMFRAFAQAHTEGVDKEWEKGGHDGTQDLGVKDAQEDCPVFRVNALVAHRFAQWLGKQATGQPKFGALPSARQWDTASGRFAADAKTLDQDGPFDKAFLDKAEWKPGDFALTPVGGRGLPMSVGTATLDRSHFGCRDMASNGLEWTSTRLRPDNKERDEPVPFDAPLEEVSVALRGTSYNHTQPFRYRDAINANPQEALKGLDDLSFRVVLTIP